jgi:YHS domain-containing protein
MNSKPKHVKAIILPASVLLVGLIAVAGCKKSEPAAAPGPEAVAAAVIDQKICPVMGGAINKDIFTEYKGKKVYFCCPSCKGLFEKEPEKYVSKLPQFNK